MQELGRLMKERREAAGLTLRDIERTTKISVRQLECIEAGRFDQLPGGLFARNFIRQYCALIGMDPEEVLCHLELGPAESESPVEETVHLHLWVRVIVLLALVLAGGFGYWWWRGHPEREAVPEKAQELVNGMASRYTDGDRKPQDTLARPVSQEIGVPETDPVASATADTNTLSSKLDGELSEVTPERNEQPVNEQTDSTPVMLEFTVSDRCWIHLSSPGRDMDFILEKGERYAVRCDHPIRITLGNAPAVTLTMNGRPVLIPTGDRVLRDFELPRSLE